MPCFTAFVSSSFNIRASGIATSLESTPCAAPHSIRVRRQQLPDGFADRRQESSAANRVASLRAVQHALRRRHGRDPRAGFVEDLPRLLAVRGSGRGEQQRLQHLHVVLDAMIEFVEQQALLGLRLPALADVHQHVDRADDPAGRVAQRRRKRNEGNACAVRPFGDRLGVADRRGLP